MLMFGRVIPFYNMTLNLTSNFLTPSDNVCTELLEYVYIFQSHGVLIHPMKPFLITCQVLETASNYIIYLIIFCRFRVIIICHQR